jgi:cell division protein FtsB
MSNDFLMRRIQLKPMWVLYALLLLLIVYFFSSSVQNNRMANLHNEKAVRETILAEAQNEIEKLRRELSFRGTNEYIARVARETYGYFQEGEIRFMFEGVTAPEHVAPSVPVEFVPVEHPAGF